jgi:hypothetical protein
MAEVYWDLEWTLQQQGFNYTYDKRLYDRLRDRRGDQLLSPGLYLDLPPWGYNAFEMTTIIYDVVPNQARMKSRYR